MPTLDILFDQHLTASATNMSNIYRKAMDSATQMLISEYGKKGALLSICFILAAANLLTNFFKYFSLRIITRIRANVIYNLRKHIFDKLTTFHLGYFTNERKGDLVSRITNDVQEVENSVINTLTVLFRDPLTIIIYFTVLFFLSWKLTLITIIILPVSGIIISGISKRLKRESEEGQHTLGQMLSIVDEMISGMRVVFAFNAQQYMYNKFDQQNKQYVRLLKTMYDKRELASPLSEFMGVSVVGVVLWIGGSMVLKQEMKASEFFFYIISFYQILVPAKALSNSFSSIQRGLASADRIFKIIDTPTQISDAPDATDAPPFSDAIEFKNVCFRYGHEEVLKNINIRISKGKMIALVGPSGAGKSTLADLIPRFYDTTSGNIFIDGRDVRSLTLDSLRAQIAVVTQEPILFNDTVYNNILFGNPGCSEEQVIEAARIAYAHDFIMQLEHGYHTHIGDRGMKLSGGQRQRISIARAVIKNPAILILDEATSALDTESEKWVQAALSTLMQNRTSLVIAHRLSTIQNADEIIVLDKGKIVQHGTHKELMQEDGLYRKLHLNGTSL